MYGKLFASAFSGSMVGSGLNVFAVWGYAIANADREGTVEINPPILAAILGCSVGEVDAAIDKLTAPDPRSRNKTNEGRRLMQAAPFLYTITTHADYRGIRDEQGRREYMRNYMRDRRSAEKDTESVNNPANTPANGKPVLAQLAHTDTEIDKSKDQETCAPAIEPPAAPPEGIPPKPKKKRGTDECFEAFWDEYPRRTNKKTARQVWKANGMDDKIDLIIEHLKRRILVDEQWKRGVIPHASTFLRQERWEDEIGAPKAKPPATPSPAVPEPKRPPMSDEERQRNARRVNDVITATLAGKRPTA